MGGGDQETTSTKEPWEAAQPDLKRILAEASRLYDAGQSTGYYPGQTYIDPSADTMAAQSMIRNRAAQGSPLLGASEQNLTDTLQGDYLSAGNPYFSQMADRVRGEVMPQIQSAYGGAGRAGSAGNTEAMSRGLADSIGALAYQNYGDERMNQMRGQTLAPGIEDAGYMPARQLGLLGQSIEAYEGQRLQDDISRFNFNEQAPWDLLGRYGGFASGMGAQGGTTTQTQPGQSPFQTIAGLGMMAAAPFTGGASMMAAPMLGASGMGMSGFLPSSGVPTQINWF